MTVIPFLARYAVSSILTFGCAVSVATPQDANPDFTRGGAIPKDAPHDWTLGATGARGWMYGEKLVTTEARQIAITEVANGSPADGVLEAGDVVLGVSGTPFSYDPRTEFGKALTVAESEAARGELSLIRWRDGERRNVTLTLPVLGDYSTTAPYECAKSRRILELGCATLAKRIANPKYRANPIPRSLNALALLASGDPQYLPLIRKEVQWAADFSSDSFQTWYYGYVITLLAEYKMATGDDSVMPGLQRLALEAANGQSLVGSWGHGFVKADGRLSGYGMMNAPGLPLTISLVLARKAGVRGKTIQRAIDRSLDLLRFYIGKGAIPYGDHHPWIETHEDNGKCGMASVLFHLLGEAHGAAFFSRMSLASHGAERDCGHTGNFFNVFWALPSVARSGPIATGEWMEEFGAWYFDLARCHDGSFRHQGPPEKRNDKYARWDCTGAYLLSYAMPLEKLYLTGKGKTALPKLDEATARTLIADGHGWNNKDRKSFFDGLDDDALFTRLRSWSPVVRERAAMALGRRKGAHTERLITLLGASNLHARYGACQALKLQRKRAATAVPALLDAFRADDLWLRVLAADALAGIGAPARKAVPEMLTRLTKRDPKNDPRYMEQRYLSFALFNRRGGLIGRSLDGIDRKLLLKAVRAGLRNEDGRARGSYGSVYRNLAYEELKPLLPAIRDAIAEPAPSGIMFANQIRMSGMELFAKHHISEGIELLVEYARNQNPWASEKRIVKVMEMLRGYGTHAKRVIPQLRSAADYFENDEPNFPKRLSLGKAKLVRETIAAIEASTEKPKLVRLGR